MKKWMMMAALGVAWMAVPQQAGAAGDTHRLGGGAHYWVTIDDIDTEDVDEDGFSYFASYQYKPGLLGLELDVEFLPDLFGKDAYAPQAYLLLGGWIYAAAGVGILNLDSEWADDPFYALRAGLDLELLPNLHLDIFGNYRFNEGVALDDAVREIDTDTVFLGAAFRIGFQ